ncbi:DUF6193 family natural product biosynthesis protein [Streptomyces sp. NPDC001941]|uniref:DUF6193 family natural product biosynthesis protein n=1 Tax=Streptomyces sp. NPDC001941 TaxID=3154659 RepID=UPI00332BA2C9
MNPELYPDLETAGGLAAALETVASGLGLDLTLHARPGTYPDHAAIASMVPGRGPLAVNIADDVRRFSVSGWGQGIALLSGATPDLADIARAGVAWSEGRCLRRMQAELPFLVPSERGEAHERGPAAVVDLQWRSMREKAAGAPEFPAFGALVEAAHDEPLLRQLYVFSSHWTLGFSSCTGYPFRVVVAIAPADRDNPYRVMTGLHGASVAEPDTAHQAVTSAVSHLPADLGPAVAGTAEDNV